MKCVYIFPSTLASALGLTAPGPTYDYGYYRCTPIVIKLHGWWFYARPCFLLPLWLLTLFVVPFLSFLLPFSLSLILSILPFLLIFFFIIGLGSHIATPCRCCCRSLLAATHSNFSLHLLLWIHFSFNGPRTRTQRLSHELGCARISSRVASCIFKSKLIGPFSCLFHSKLG